MHICSQDTGERVSISDPKEEPRRDPRRKVLQDSHIEDEGNEEEGRVAEDQGVLALEAILVQRADQGLTFQPHQALAQDLAFKIVGLVLVQEAAPVPPLDNRQDAMMLA